MVDYCLKLSLRPPSRGCVRREIMSAMKSVTIMMIDGVCFPGVVSSARGTGRVLGEGHQRDGCGAHSPKHSQGRGSTFWRTKEKSNNKKDIKPENGGAGTNVVSPFVQWTVLTSYLVYAETKTCRLQTSFCFSATFGCSLLPSVSPEPSPHCSLPSGGPQYEGWSTTSPHSHIHLWADWNKSELLSGPRPPCNWILPCFTECNKA